MAITGSVMNHQHNNEYQTGNNWIRFPNGFTIQWGENNVQKNGKYNPDPKVNFPRKFTNKLHVHYTTQYSEQINSFNLKQDNVSIQLEIGRHEIFGVNLKWIAFGWS